MHSPLVRVPVLRWGLAAGLLLDLVFGGVIRVERGSIILMRPQLPVDDAASVIVRALQRAGNERGVDEWLVFVAQQSHRLVAGRLVEAGVVGVASRGRFRRGLGYLPIDIGVTAWPRIQLTHPVGSDGAVRPTVAALFAVLSTLNIAGIVTAGVAPETTSLLRVATAELRPSAVAILTALDAALTRDALHP